jgi:HPt (histidine-containing phosphotransfer) domain-containing protein
MRVVDYEVLSDLVQLGAGCGQGFLDRMLARFARDARDSLERMRACARVGDAPRLAVEAHRLKGTSGTLGAVALEGECRELERCARAGSCAGMEARVLNALTLLDVTHAHLAKFFHGNIADAV